MMLSAFAASVAGYTYRSRVARQRQQRNETGEQLCALCPLPSQSFVRLFSLLSCLFVVSAHAADTELHERLQRVEHRYNNSTTLQVLFMEQYTPPGGIRRTERGELNLRKPGRIRWDYSQPKGKLWISDSKYVWTYDPVNNKAERTQFKESEDMRAPLAFLLGKLHFNLDFRNLQAKPDGADTRIKAEPKGGNLPYSTVEFVITPMDEIREVKVTGFDRSIYDFVFDQEKLDPPLPPSIFKFQPPPGIPIEETTP